MQSLIQRDSGGTSRNICRLFFRIQPRFHLLRPRTLRHIIRFTTCNNPWRLPNPQCPLPRFHPILWHPRSLSLRFSRCSIRPRSSAVWKYSTPPNSSVLLMRGDGPFSVSVRASGLPHATPNMFYSQSTGWRRVWAQDRASSLQRKKQHAKHTMQWDGLPVSKKSSS